jgi:hypothetical protein
MDIIGFLCASIGSSTVCVVDAYTHIRGLVSVVKMATMLEECTTEEQSQVVHFYGQKDSMQRIFINKYVLFMSCGKCLSHKVVHTRVEKFSLGRSKVAGDETKVRLFLRQKSKDFCAAGFSALVKRWDKCISVGGGYIEE